MSEIEHSYEFTHHPEEAGNDKAIRRLELLGLNETLAEPMSRRNFFRDLGDEDYQQLLGYVNSVTRGEPISYEYADGRLSHIETPSLEDKAPLMQQTFEAVRSILAREDLEPAEALDMAGLTLAGAVNYIHPYEDGNGRTARVAHYLVTYGAERSKDQFEAELYGAIANIPAYDVDSRLPMVDQPPYGIMDTVEEYLLAQPGPEGAAQDLVHPSASRKIRTYLQVMRGELNLSLRDNLDITYFNKGGRVEFVEIPAGTDLMSYYRKSYSVQSSVPNNLAGSIPAAAKRVYGKPYDPFGSNTSPAVPRP